MWGHTGVPVRNNTTVSAVGRYSAAVPHRNTAQIKLANDMNKFLYQKNQNFSINKLSGKMAEWSKALRLGSSKHPPQSSRAWVRVCIRFPLIMSPS